MATQPFKWPEAMKLISKYKESEDYRMYLFTAIQVYTGYRIGDILTLKWQDILQDVITIKESKKFSRYEEKVKKWMENGKEGNKPQRPDIRKVRINESLKSIIQECYLEAGEPLKRLYVFRAKSGRSGNKPMAPRCINESLKNVAGTTSHALRKTYGTKIYQEAGADHKALLIAQKALNHNDPAITVKYLGISQELVDDITMRL